MKHASQATQSASTAAEGSELAARGATVALLGPDGVGKSSLAAAVVETFPLKTRVIYMGLYPVKARRLVLPQLVVRFLYAWFRYVQASTLRARGKVVIFDRYTYDAAISGGLRLGRFKRFYRALLARACPAPDLTIVLDAPADILRARKPEHSLPELELRRGQYLALAERVPRAVVVSTAEEQERTRRRVISLITSVAGLASRR